MSKPGTNHTFVHTKSLPFLTTLPSERAYQAERFPTADYILPPYSGLAPKANLLARMVMGNFETSGIVRIWAFDEECESRGQSP
jgi:hypothetical protein